MSSANSISLINNPDTYSDGALPMSYTPQCAPQLFQAIKTSDLTQRADLFLSAFQAGMQGYLREFHYWGTSGGITISEPTKERIVSHYYLTHLPDLAIKEACNSLQNIWEFYGQVIAPTALLPEPITKKKAKLGKKYERPEFSINPGE